MPRILIPEAPGDNREKLKQGILAELAEHRVLPVFLILPKESRRAVRYLLQELALEGKVQRSKWYITGSPSEVWANSELNLPEVTYPEGLNRNAARLYAYIRSFPGLTGTQLAHVVAAAEGRQILAWLEAQGRIVVVKEDPHRLRYYTPDRLPAPKSPEDPVEMPA
jgi:hypothetical protein